MSVSALKPLLRNALDAAPLTQLLCGDDIPPADVLYSFANVRPEVSRPGLNECIAFRKSRFLNR